MTTDLLLVLAKDNMILSLKIQVWNYPAGNDIAWYDTSCEMHPSDGSIIVWYQQTPGSERGNCHLTYLPLFCSVAQHLCKVWRPSRRWWGSHTPLREIFGICYPHICREGRKKVTQCHTDINIYFSYLNICFDLNICFIMRVYNVM